MDKPPDMMAFLHPKAKFPLRLPETRHQPTLPEGRSGQATGHDGISSSEGKISPQAPGNAPWRRVGCSTGPERRTARGVSFPAVTDGILTALAEGRERLGVASPLSKLRGVTDLRRNPLKRMAALKAAVNSDDPSNFGG